MKSWRVLWKFSPEVQSCAVSTRIIALTVQAVLVERLLPGNPVLALELIFELHKSVDPGEVAFFCLFIELRDHFIDGEFKAVFAIILVDFKTTIVTRIVALQLVTFG